MLYFNVCSNADRSRALSIDPDIAEDLMSGYDEKYNELQHSLNKLSQQADDTELINQIFRTIHTVKGNAAMFQLQPLVDFTHIIEEVIQSIRAGYFLPTPKICDLLLTGTDRLRDLHNAHLFNKDYEFSDEATLTSGFINMASARSDNEAEEHADLLYRALYPGTDITQAATEDIDNFSLDDIANHQHYIECNDDHYIDLDFFRDLSLQTDTLNNFWKQRTNQLVYLAIKLLPLSQTVLVNKVQLVAAIYMHDIGMAFLHDDIVNKQSKLNGMEFIQLKRHVDWGYSILKRMPEWQEAATMVLQHHEKEDGSGYPNNMTSDTLHEGAKVIAILDAFYAMTNLRSDRSHRRSIMRAISEINACSGTQFNPYWVELFNELIRNEIKHGNTDLLTH